MRLTLSVPRGYDHGAFHVSAVLNDEERTIYEQIQIAFQIPSLPNRCFRQEAGYRIAVAMPNGEIQLRGVFHNGLWFGDFYTNGIPEHENPTPPDNVRAALEQSINTALQTAREWLSICSDYAHNPTNPFPKEVSMRSLACIILAIPAALFQGCFLSPTNSDPTPQPEISVSQSSIAANCRVGELPGPRSFQVWNSGTGILHVSFVSNANWLSCNPSLDTSSSVSDKKIVNLVFNTSSLAVQASQYSAQIAILCETAKAETISVSLQVVPLPQGMLIVPAKAKSFLMGSTNNSDEMPIHTVSFAKDFWMDTTETTQSAFINFMGYNPSTTSSSNYPVGNVSWYDAVLFCNKRSNSEGLDSCYRYTSRTTMDGTATSRCTGLANLFCNFSSNGYRLSTEAEWEYACRGGTTTTYFWGTGIASTYALYAVSNPTRVASKSPNPYGVYDMSGSMREWCNDWYGSFSSFTITDPMGSSTGDSRVLRGGSYDRSIDLISSSAREYYTPDQTNYNIGFRTISLVNK